MPLLDINDNLIENADENSKNKGTKRKINSTHSPMNTREAPKNNYPNKQIKKVNKKTQSFM
jgi:hypothetical protein